MKLPFILIAEKPHTGFFHFFTLTDGFLAFNKFGMQTRADNTLCVFSFTRLQNDSFEQMQFHFFIL